DRFGVHLGGSANTPADSRTLPKIGRASCRYRGYAAATPLCNHHTTNPEAATTTRAFHLQSRIVESQLLRRSHAYQSRRLPHATGPRTTATTSLLRHSNCLAFRAEQQAHLPGRDNNQRQLQAGEQRKSIHVAGSGAATGSASTWAAPQPRQRIRGRFP